jgi:hypothetical protein
LKASAEGPIDFRHPARKPVRELPRLEVAAGNKEIERTGALDCERMPISVLLPGMRNPDPKFSLGGRLQESGGDQIRLGLAVALDSLAICGKVTCVSDTAPEFAESPRSTWDQGRDPNRSASCASMHLRRFNPTVIFTAWGLTGLRS